MATSATGVYGCVIDWDSAGGTSYTTIGEIRSFSGPSLKREAAEATSLDASSPGAREFIPTLFDGGEFSFTVNFLPANAQHQALVRCVTTTAAASYSKRFRIRFSDGSATPMSFLGIVTAAEPKGDDLAAALQLEFTVKVTGSVTY